MSLKIMNEAFKRKYSDVLTESVDESYKAQLKKALVMRSMNVVANGGNKKDLEIALQSVIEEFFPDKCWWEVTDCNIFMELLGGANPREVCDMIVDQLKSDCCDGDDCPQFVDTRKQSIISGDPSMDNGVDLYEGSMEETVSNPEKTISKIDKNLAKVVDTDMVRDLTLIIENDGDVYRRFTTPVIANLKRKRAKGNFDDKLAIQAFVHVVENALRQPYFYRYYSYDIKSVPVSVRYAVAKELLDGAMEEIEFEDTNESVRKDRMAEGFDDMEPEVWDYPDTDSRYRDTYSYSPYDNAHNEIADRIRRKGYIGSSSHSDGMTPINLDDKCAPKFNKNYLRRTNKKKELLGV